MDKREFISAVLEKIFLIPLCLLIGMILLTDGASFLDKFYKLKEGMDMTEQVFCPICGQDCTHARRDKRAGVIFFDCPTCGEYGISKEADLYVRDLSQSEKIKLSAYFRERDIRGDPPILPYLKR